MLIILGIVIFLLWAFQSIWLSCAAYDEQNEWYGNDAYLDEE